MSEERTFIIVIAGDNIEHVVADHWCIEDGALVFYAGLSRLRAYAPTYWREVYESE
jgi:hypothetical protein